MVTLVVVIEELMLLKVWPLVVVMRVAVVSLIEVKVMVLLAVRQVVASVLHVPVFKKKKDLFALGRYKN